MIGHLRVITICVAIGFAVGYFGCVLAEVLF